MNMRRRRRRRRGERDIYYWVYINIVVIIGVPPIAVASHGAIKHDGGMIGGDADIYFTMLFLFKKYSFFSFLFIQNAP